MHPQQGGLVHGVFRLLSGIVSIPIAVLKTSFHFCRVVVSLSLTTTAQLLLPSSVQGGVSASFWRGLKFNLDRFIATNGTPDPVLQAADFVRSFQRQYGSQHPNFAEMGWKEAAREAENQSKLLFAYLHSPEHEVSQMFSEFVVFDDWSSDVCSQVLASSEVITFLNQHFICWGGSIDRSPAFIVSLYSFLTTTFTFS